MVSPTLSALTGPDLRFDRIAKPCSQTVRELIVAWDHVCRQALETGSVDDLQAIRDDYLAVLAGHLKILDGYLMVQSRLPDEPSRADEAERLARARDELQKHFDFLFPRWQTLEDLEAILLERISLPNDRLKALAANHPPPQSWYDEPDAPRRRRKRT
jgi:hypothetical protein